MAEAGLYDPDANRSIRTSQMPVSFSYGWVNYCERAFVKMEQSVNTGVDRSDHFKELLEIGDKDDQGFGIITALYFIYLPDRFYLECITAYTPNGIRRVQ